MPRIALFAFLLFVLAVPALAQVQTIGDLSFAVPDGWQYQQGADFGAMVLKTSDRFWMIAVYTPMHASGNPDADFKAAWQRVLSPAGYSPPAYTPYNLSATVGYPGKYYDLPNDNNATYARLYILETGTSCIPMALISLNRQVLDAMEHMARAVAGSVRVAPLKASRIGNTIAIRDLTGYWTTALTNSIDFYNSAGQYQSNSFSAIRTSYTIAANGSYTYKLGGMINNRMTSEEDAGVVELSGEFITFKGQRHVTRYRFLNLQQALDGSTVLIVLPDGDMSHINIGRDSTYYVRPVKK